MTKQELIAKAAEAEGITKAQAQRVIEFVTETIKDEVAAGRPFTVVGLGTFKQVHKAEKSGRNPKTGEPLTIPAHNSVHFSASKAFKDALN